MKLRLARFNMNLRTWGAFALALALPWMSGCKTAGDPEQKKRGKELTLLFLHLESNPGGASDRSQAVSVLRSAPVLVEVQREAVLNQNNIEAAFILQAPGGGFSIKIQFDRHGTLLLENVTTSYRGRRLGVFSQFGDARWLAAPVIAQRIGDGQLVFTPDATLEEAERIVRGLTNGAAARKEKSKF